MPLPASLSPILLGLLRIVTGLLFLQHGTAKLLGFPAVEMFAGGVSGLMLVAGLLELVGGALIVLGLLTRPVALVLSGEMAVAYVLAHAPQGFMPLLNGGELAALYAFVFLYVAAAGPGRFALDDRLGSRAVPA